EESQAETRDARGKWADRQRLPLKNIDNDDIDEGHEPPERDQATPEDIGRDSQRRVGREQRNIDAPVPKSGEVPKPEREQQEDEAASQTNRRRDVVRARAFSIDGLVDLRREVGSRGGYCWMSTGRSPHVRRPALQAVAGRRLQATLGDFIEQSLVADLQDPSGFGAIPLDPVEHFGEGLALGFLGATPGDVPQALGG